jgi:hypothetical protein
MITMDVKMGIYMSSDERGKGCLVIPHTFVSARVAFKQCWYLISKFRNFKWQCSREMAHRLKIKRKTD